VIQDMIEVKSISYLVIGFKVDTYWYKLKSV